jgi:hypothetical protein
MAFYLAVFEGKRKTPEIFDAYRWQSDPIEGLYLLLHNTFPNA